MSDILVNGEAITITLSPAAMATLAALPKDDRPAESLYDIASVRDDDTTDATVVHLLEVTTRPRRVMDLTLSGDQRAAYAEAFRRAYRVRRTVAVRGGVPPMGLRARLADAAKVRPRSVAEMLDAMSEEEQTAVANGIVAGRDATLEERTKILEALRAYPRNRFEHGLDQPVLGGIGSGGVVPANARLQEGEGEVIIPLRQPPNPIIYGHVLTACCACARGNVPAGAPCACYCHDLGRLGREYVDVLANTIGKAITEGIEASINDPAVRANMTDADTVIAAATVAECYRCGRIAITVEKIGTPCQRDGCEGRYIKT